MKRSSKPGGFPSRAANKRPHRAGRTDTVDADVGRRIRLRRLLLGLTQEMAASALGTTAKQIEKYELGVSRLSAFRLVAMSDLLRVSLSYFFADVFPNPLALNEQDKQYLNQLESAETIELIRFYCMMDDDSRQLFLQSVKAASASCAGRGTPSEKPN